MACYFSQEGRKIEQSACCKVSPSTVTNLWEKYNESGSMNERNDRRTGAPRKTTPRHYRALRLQERLTDLKQLPKLEGKVNAEAYYRLLRHQMSQTMHLCIQLRRIYSSLSEITMNYWTTLRNHLT